MKTKKKKKMKAHKNPKRRKETSKNVMKKSHERIAKNKSINKNPQWGLQILDFSLHLFLG